MTTLLSAKDDEITLLKAKQVVAQTKGPGSDEMVELKAKNDDLSTKWPNSRTSYLNFM